MKTCPSCKQELAEDAFGRNKSRRDGLSWGCKNCKAAGSKAYSQENKERVAQSQRAYRQANKEKEAERKRAYHQENADQVWQRMIAWLQPSKAQIEEKNRWLRREAQKLEARRIWNLYAKNKEKTKDRVGQTSQKCREANQEKFPEFDQDYCKKQKAERDRKYYEANKEKIKDRQRKYTAANKEKVAQTSRKHREFNKEKVADSRRKYNESNGPLIRARNAAISRRLKAELADSFIRHELTRNSNLRAADIPPQLIELKRAHLLIRLELKKEDHEKC